jgi:hypothetical protein
MCTARITKNLHAAVSDDGVVVIVDKTRPRPDAPYQIHQSGMLSQRRRSPAKKRKVTTSVGSAALATSRLGESAATV